MTEEIQPTYKYGRYGYWKTLWNALMGKPLFYKISVWKSELHNVDNKFKIVVPKVDVEIGDK